MYLGRGILVYVHEAVMVLIKILTTNPGVRRRNPIFGSPNPDPGFARPNPGCGRPKSGFGHSHPRFAFQIQDLDVQI